MIQKMNKLKTGPWNLTDLESIEKNGLKVFSCFHCGGGSTMGYKLAGYDVLGGVEIDPEMMKIYKANHNPKYSYLMGVQDFNKIPNEELPAELFELDILDGSPPCSSFSMAGSREKGWGKNKHFREGQAKQILDDLFFDFIDVATKLKPKVVVAENVKGLIQGKAKGYVKQIYQKFNDAGYDVQLFLLNAAFMGVPQRRERTFFVARRKDLEHTKLNLTFNENIVSVEKSLEGTTSLGHRQLRPSLLKYWSQIIPGKSVSTVNESGSSFCRIKIDPKKPSNTLSADLAPMHWKEPRHLSPSECIRLQSFADDFNFLNHKYDYLLGMSVPPFMMQRISNQIAHQLFNKTELLNG